MRLQPGARAGVMTIALLAVAACNQNAPTAPTDLQAAGAVKPTTGKPELIPESDVTGERIFGNQAIEPAYDADTGELLYLLTPVKAPLPSHANEHAVSPLYLVVYPAGAPTPGIGHFNCEGTNPGNCPDHDDFMAQQANDMEPDVYPDPAAVPGHDHVVDPPGAPDWNVAWQVVVVAFTPAGVTHYGGVANLPHLTTDTAIEDAEEAGYVVFRPLFPFNCSVVPAVLYAKGQPVGGG